MASFSTAAEVFAPLTQESPQMVTWGMRFSPRPLIPAFDGRTGQPRRNALDVHAFDAETVEAAYWAGFLYADGSVAHKPKWVLTVNLAEKDVERLHALIRFLGADIARVKMIKAASRSEVAGRPILGGPQVHFDLASRDLCITLVHWGVTPRKSIEPCSPPTLAGPAQRAFLRGLFDGDGCVHKTKRGYLQAAFCGHPAVVRWFVAQSGVEHQGLKMARRTHYAEWTGGSRVRALLRILYDAPGPALARKRELALGCI